MDREDQVLATTPAERLGAAGIWRALQAGMEPGRTYRVAELYEQVAARCPLSERDLEPAGPDGRGLRWQRTVRGVLHRRKGTGHLRWDGRGGFTLPR